MAAYCRVSTDSEDQENSFLAQVKYYTDYISSNKDMALVDIYDDLHGGVDIALTGLVLKGGLCADNERACLILCLAEEILDLVHVFLPLTFFSVFFVVRLRMEHSYAPN